MGATRRAPPRVGVRLANLSEGARAGAHVHAATAEWAITSDACAADDARVLDGALLDRALPGALGCYVYPADAVLCLLDRATTTAADAAGLVRRYAEEAHALAAEARARRAHAARALNHLTLAPGAAPPDGDDAEGARGAAREGDDEEGVHEEEEGEGEAEDEDEDEDEDLGADDEDLEADAASAAGDEDDRASDPGGDAPGDGA